MSYLETLEEPRVLTLNSRWIAVSKPAGWLTIPGRNLPEKNSSNKNEPIGSLAGENLENFKGKNIPVVLDWVKERYPAVWVTHRLDLETSGVLLFARTPEDHRQANLWFQNRKMKKVYFCLAEGSPSSPVFKIQEPIAGASAVTQVEVKESYSEGFLARVLISSGRRHQIRIHLSKQGYPIWGDSFYKGCAEVRLGAQILPIQRVALHARSLELPTGEKFESSFPQDFESWLAQLRAGGTRVGAC